MAASKTTRDLINRAKDGDRAAFDLLVERYQEQLRSRIERWAKFQMGPQLSIDEILQDCFVRAYQGLEKFKWREKDSFLRWLCGVAKISIADATRTAHRNAMKMGADLKVSDCADQGPSQSRAARRGERFERLEGALSNLPPDYRRVLLLSRIEGMTMKEIARDMDRTPNAVKHLLARALRQLKSTFGKTDSFHLPDRSFQLEGDDDDRNE